jgi:hypothetical protein
MTEQPQNLYITPQQADSIVNRAVVGMLDDYGFDIYTIRMLCDHLRAALVPLVKVETEEGQT